MGADHPQDAAAKAHAGRFATPGVPPGRAVGPGVGPHFLHHRELLGKLARAAWDTVRELMAAAALEPEPQPGMVAAVQTAGDLAGWHPHVHALVSRGGWARSGEWVPVPYVDEHAAELVFRHRVISLLQGEGLLSEERTTLLLSWRQTVLTCRFAARDVPCPAGGRTPPCPLSGRAAPFLRPPRLRPRTAAGGECLARVPMHVPEPRRHLVRYYGAYSNAARGRRRRLAGGAPVRLASAGVLADDDGEGCAEVRLFRRRWRELVKRIYEVDPSVCPNCQGEMRIIAFIIDHAVVDHSCGTWNAGRPSASGPRRIRTIPRLRRDLSARSVWGGVCSRPGSRALVEGLSRSRRPTSLRDHPVDGPSPPRRGAIASASAPQPRATLEVCERNFLSARTISNPLSAPRTPLGRT